MDFEPKTTIYFSRTGIDDQNKVVVKSESDMLKIMTLSQNYVGVCNETSFQRADGYFTIRVDHNDIPYYQLLQADTVAYKNINTTDAFWIVGNIIAVEWKNPDCSFVRFKIDHFMTYQTKIDWSTTYALIEREHIKDDWSGDGGNPLFSNMGPAEDFGTIADTPFYTWTKNFTPDMVVIMSPYNDSGEAVFDGDIRGNLYTSLQIDVLDPATANQRFKQIAEKKEASINNIVGVYGCPSEWARCIKNGGFPGGFGGSDHDTQEELPAINIAAKKLPGMPEYNNAKCWSGPFMNVRLMSSDGQTVDFTPQWFGNDVDEYTLRYRIAGCGGLFGGAQCTFQNRNGAFNWKAWNDFIVSLQELPSCPWTGDGFTDWASVNLNAAKFSAANAGWKAIGSIFRGAVGAAVQAPVNPVGAGVSLLTGTVEAIGDMTEGALNLSAQINNAKATGATVTAGGTFNSLLDIADDAWGFKVIYYGTQIYTMLAVDAYFDRFGYRINKLKKLELENRPIWTFIKTAECHVNSSSGVPFISERSINNMFNNGVTMWKFEKYIGGRKIGDFSNPKENRGIKG